MEDQMLVSKWSNSLAIRLPKTVVDSLGLKEGDDFKVTMQATGSAAMVVEKPRKKHELLHSLRKYRGLLPADDKFDREEANARGKWDDPE